MQTVPQMLEWGVRLAPDKPLIIFEDQVITYSEADRLSNKLANALSGLGLVKGDRAAYLLPNVPLIGICELAFLKLGLTSVPLNSMARGPEVKYIAENSGFKVLITDHSGYQVVSGVRDDLPLIAGGLIVSSDQTFPDAQSFRDLTESSGENFTPVPCRDDDVACILYTSGTTGSPKGTMQTHKSIFFGVTHMASAHKFRFGKEVFLCVLPIYNNFGRTVFFLNAINLCSTVILLERWDTEKVLDAITKWDATYIGGTPTMYIYLMEGFKPEKHRIKIPTAFVGGSKCPPDVLAQFRERFGVNLVEGYGSTELCGFVTTNPTAGIKKIGSAGLPIGDVTIRIVDDAGSEVKQGEVGEIVIESDMKSKGYWNDPENTQYAFREDGWYSGDLGYVDQDGYLFIVDRKKDLIIRGGANIFPIEVEEALYTHESVSMTAVIGIPDRVKGELPKAYVVLREGSACTEEELISHCRKRLAAYKVPTGIEFVDELPLNRVGKILRRTLREKVLKELARSKL